MAPRRRSRADIEPPLPGIPEADVDDAPDAAELPADDLAPVAPEPDRWTQELPLDEPPEGLAADFVNDITQIYLNEIGRHALLAPEEELALSPRVERRRLRRAAEDDRAQPATRRQHRQALHQPRARAAGPDRGRQPRPHPRAGEVRPRARLPLHDLRDVVDPAGGRARDHEPVADDPAARARGEGAQRGAARAAPPRDPCAGGRPRGDARRRRAPARTQRRGRPARDRLQRARDLARRAARPRVRAVDRRSRRRRGARSRRSCCCTTPRSRRWCGSGWTSCRRGSAR